MMIFEHIDLQEIAADVAFDAVWDLLGDETDPDEIVAHPRYGEIIRQLAD